ncbi:MAG: methyltransferase domain-containing protein [Actinomycetota bacterium]
MPEDYSGYVDPDYLDASARVMLPSKLRTYELMELQEGHRVLDLGCGPASDTIALAETVGETGRVVGVDADADMVAEANERARAAELSERVTHEHADAASLPFEDDFFDACRSERVFQHLLDPAAALAELIRVTRPGGRIVVLDTDYGAASIATEFSEIERRLIDQYCAMMNGPFVARLLTRMFNSAGLDDVAVEPVPFVLDDIGAFSTMFLLDRVLREAVEAGRLSGDQVRRFRTDLEQSAEIGGFLASAHQLLVSGRKRRG